MSGARYRTASPRRVASPVLVSCSLEARVVYLHLLVGEVATNLPGLVRVGMFGLVDETALAPEVVTKALAELVTKNLAEVDEAARLIRLPGVAEDHARSAENPKTVAGWVNSLLALPPSPLLDRHILELRAVCPDRLASVWRPIANKLPIGGLSLAKRTKDQDQDQDQVNTPNPSDEGDDAPDDSQDDLSDGGEAALLAEVLDQLAAERGRLTGVPGPAAPPSPRERKAWLKFCQEARAARAEVLRAVLRAAESLRRRGRTSGLTLAHLLRNWERLRDAHDLDVPVAQHARAPPPSARVLTPPQNPDLFNDL